MNKRAIAILGAIFLLIVATLGFLIYQRSKNSSDTSTNIVVDDQPSDQSNSNTNTGSDQPVGKAIKASDDSVVSPILFYQGTGISYFTKSGQLFQTDLQIADQNVLLSNKHELSIALKPNMSRVLWPQVGNSFIAEFNIGRKTWSAYDGSKAVYVDLPQKISSIDWLPDGTHIMYVWVDNGKASLFRANIDATGFAKVLDFFDQDTIIDVSPDGQTILFYRTQTIDPITNKIVSVNSTGKTFKTVVSDGYNKGTLWSPDSKKFLFTKKDPSSLKYSLWVADTNSGEVRSLGVSTSEQKAVWAKDGQTIYVGVPVQGTTGEGLTQDTIYKINVVSQSKQEYQPGSAIDAQDLFLSATENVLFFRNAQDGALYYIKL